MTDETREQIALFRYKLISPVLAEPGRVQNDYFRTQADREHNVPHYGPRKIKPSTMKGWLKRNNSPRPVKIAVVASFNRSGQFIAANS